MFDDGIALMTSRAPSSFSSKWKMRKTYISTFHKALIKLRVVERGRAFIVIVYSQPTTHPEGITLQNISGNTDNARKDISQKKYGRSLIKPVLICQNHVENSADHFSRKKKLGNTQPTQPEPESSPSSPPEDKERPTHFGAGPWLAAEIDELATCLMARGMARRCVLKLMMMVM